MQQAVRRRWRCAIELVCFFLNHLQKQRDDALAPIAQGGQFDVHDIQPKVEITPEGALVDHDLQGLLGRCNDAHVHGNEPSRTQALHPAALQHTQ